MVAGSEQGKTVVINLGEIHVSSNPETALSCLGLGSCIALCMYDPLVRVGGMAHIVLPCSRDGASGGMTNTKYADVAIPSLLQQMRDCGAVKAHLVVKIVGGAQMLSFGASRSFNTGEKNLVATKEVLAGEALEIAASDVGGNRGRTVKMEVETGRVIVKTVGDSAVEL